MTPQKVNEFLKKNIFDCLKNCIFNIFVCKFYKEPFDHLFIKLTQCLERKAVLHIILKGSNLAHDQRVRRQYVIPFVNDINFNELMIKKKFFAKITIVELMSWNINDEYSFETFVFQTIYPSTCTDYTLFVFSI